MLKTLDNNSGHFGEDMLEEGQMLLNHIYGKLQERQKSFDTIFNGSQQMAIENSILIAFLEKLKLKVEETKVLMLKSGSTSKRSIQDDPSGPAMHAFALKFLKPAMNGALDQSILTFPPLVAQKSPSHKVA